jgi:exonuclease SbcD
MLLVDLNELGLAAVTALPVPRFQALISCSGNLATLAGAITAAAFEGTAQKPVWLEVTVAEDDYLSDLPERIGAMTQGLPVEVLRVRRQRGTSAAILGGELTATLDELSPHEVFARRLAAEDLAPELQQALSQRYSAVVASLKGAVE